MEVSAEMRDTLHKLEEDEDVRVIVLRGSGQKAFCVGADIKEFPKVWDDVIGKKLMNENLAIDAIELLDKPIPSLFLLSFLPAPNDLPIHSLMLLVHP